MVRGRSKPAACSANQWKLSSEDEKEFIDPSKVAYFVAEEYEITTV
jgi:hypothetical protein